MSLTYPEFRAARCTRYRYRYSECSSCARACPHEAILLNDEGAILDMVRCQNCTLCVSACHTGAWISDALKPVELLRQAIRRERFSIACAPCGAEADAKVPCLGSVDGAMLAFLARRRIPVTLLGSWHCAECSHGREGAAQLALNLETLALLRAASQDESWSSVDLAEISDLPVRPKGQGAFSAGRRQLFRRFVGRALNEAAEGGDAGAAPPAPEKAIRPGAYIGTEQRELLQIVCERKDERPFRVKWHEALPLLQLSLKPGCTNCEACFRVCPTGALQIRENPGDWALIFHGDRCVACEVCMEVCQPRVLAAETEFDARPGQPERVLLSLCKQRCGRCDRFFVSPEPRPACGICQDDDDAFAAIFG